MLILLTSTETKPSITNSTKSSLFVVCLAQTPMILFEVTTASASAFAHLPILVYVPPPTVVDM